MYQIKEWFQNRLVFKVILLFVYDWIEEYYFSVQNSVFCVCAYLYSIKLDSCFLMFYNSLKNVNC